jgi:hypothetical protein
MFRAETISDRPIEGRSEAPRMAIDFGRNRASSGMGGPSPENDRGQHAEQHGADQQRGDDGDDGIGFEKSASRTRCKTDADF